ncbi:MAG: formyltetrahydrofolate deformylase [Spirochaetaceae bacterium]|nr:MAG: formyltetrahydrofolate deformylase [Spirochaetaceae bacterium]
MSDQAILLFSCPDQRGIVADVAGFIAGIGGNILDSSQHNDIETGTFFMRVEWDLSGLTIAHDQIEPRFQKIAERYNMDAQVHFRPRRPRVAVFVSKQLHCLYDLVLRMRQGEIEADICAVISNHAAAQEVTDAFGLPFYHVEVSDQNRADAEARQQAILEETGAEVVVLARYMQILSDGFVDRWHRKAINIHHSFLPAFVGAKPYHQAFTRGVKIIGATSHYVTAELDQGPIIEQDITRISHRDQVADLVRKGRNLERLVLQQAVKLHVEHRVLIFGNKTIVF